MQKYGAFAQSENYDGLIHISEISYGYVKSVNDYLKVGDKIYAEVVDVDDNDKTLCFYKVIGFDLLYEFISYPHRKMYRLIKQL